MIMDKDRIIEQRRVVGKGPGIWEQEETQGFIWK